MLRFYTRLDRVLNANVGRNMGSKGQFCVVGRRRDAVKGFPGEEPVYFDEVVAGFFDTPNDFSALGRTSTLNYRTCRTRLFQKWVPLPGRIA